MKFAVAAAAPLCRGATFRENQATERRGYNWPGSSCTIDIMNFSTANLIGGLVFGSIGFVAFIYGKRMNLWRPMFLGLGLMVYPYFVSSDIILWGAGVVGSVGLWFVRS